MSLEPRVQPVAPGDTADDRHGLASVAVIIPCFNDGKTLPEAVRRVRDESRLDELVVVDDGSTDPATLETFAALEAEGVTVVHRPNGGLAAARMTGVDATNADYILALDADDLLVPGALEKLATALDRDPTLASVWGDYRLFGEKSYLQRTSPVLDPWQITYQNDLPATMMVRRSALLAAGGWVRHDAYEDWDLWMSLAERSAEGKRVDCVVYEYRQHGVRMLKEFTPRHGEMHSEMRDRHVALFEQRRALWHRSRAPLALRLALPVIFALPVGDDRRRLLGGAACHLAHRRGVRQLARRVRSP